MAVYYNNGAESFSKQIVTNTAEQATWVYALDVDADGSVDVVAGSYGDDTVGLPRPDWGSSKSVGQEGFSSQVAVYYNAGAQSFTKQVVSDTADGTHSIFASDVDGGDLRGRDVSRRASRGDRERSSRPSVTSSTGDGAVDALLANQDSTVDVYWNDGSQSFAEQVITYSVSGTPFVYAVDMDGDASVDVLPA